MAFVNPEGKNFNRWLNDGESLFLLDDLGIENRVSFDNDEDNDGLIEWRVLTAEQAHQVSLDEKNSRDRAKETWLVNIISRGWSLFARATSGFPINKIFNWNVPESSRFHAPQEFARMEGKLQSPFLRGAAKVFEPNTQFANP